MAGIAVAEAVEQTTGLHPDLRWPNDVLLNGHKFCGILTEMNAEPTRVRYVVVGIGINVNQASFSAELEAIATSLRIESGREWSRVELTAALLKSLDSEYGKLVAGGRCKYELPSCAISKSAPRLPARVMCSSRRTAAYEGVTEGLDERGFLRVRTETGLQTVLSGGVRALDGK